MKKIAIQESVGLAAAVVGLCTVLAVAGKADCGLSTAPLSVAPNLATLPEAPRVLEQAAGVEATERQEEASIVGLWRSTFTSGGQVVDQGFDQWNSDGTEILNDTPPPSTGNVCLGVYVRSGPQTFKLKHPSWTFDGAGNLNGTAIIREQVTVAPGGNTYRGTFTVDVYNLAGNHILHLEGTLAAQRITVDF
jgi:hypothetical protein